ncbi:hypothetical protein [Natronomonas amylolytica]|uniref:hypothetical protein n=1 Tax=Natronomonas amylolytica TaxID=3108498 RepID=UPI00300BF642
MKRRTFLAATAVSLTSALAGCSLGTSVETISVTEATVEQGETATISVAAPNLSGLHIAEFPEAFRRDGPLSLGEASFDPSPDVVWQAHPPHWSFSGLDVEGTVPIRTSPETPPDSYRFGFEFDIDGEEDPRYEETAVTVKGES